MPCLSILTKAFDTGSREALWSVLAKYGCPPKFVSIFRLFQDGMKGQVLFNGDHSDPFEISNRVKQRCILTPLLFSLFFTCVFKEAMLDLDVSVYICDHLDGSSFDLRQLTAKTKTPTNLIWEVLFADNCTMMSHKPSDLQIMLDKFAEASKQFGLISLNKTKILYQPAPNFTATRPTNQWHRTEDCQQL